MRIKIKKIIIPKFLLIMFCVLLLILSGISLAKAGTTAPNKITYQGRLTDSDGVPVSDGTYTITFYLYDSEIGGDDVWSYTSSSITVTNGVFSEELDFGSGWVGTADWTEQYYFTLQVGIDDIMSPRIPFNSVAYAFNAESLDGLDSEQFLRSDGSDSLSSGTLTIASGAAFNISGTWQISGVSVTATAAELNALARWGGVVPDGDIVTTDGTQTLTNKTLTLPKINEDVTLSATSSDLDKISGYATDDATSTGYPIFVMNNQGDSIAFRNVSGGGFTATDLMLDGAGEINSTNDFSMPAAYQNSKISNLNVDYIDGLDSSDFTSNIITDVSLAISPYTPDLLDVVYFYDTDTVAQAFAQPSSSSTYAVVGFYTGTYDNGTSNKVQVSGILDGFTG